MEVRPVTIEPNRTEPPFDFYERSPERQWCEDDEAPSYEDDDDD
jgi:hypothetical protein